MIICILELSMINRIYIIASDHNLIHSLLPKFTDMDIIPIFINFNDNDIKIDKNDLFIIDTEQLEFSYQWAGFIKSKGVKLVLLFDRINRDSRIESSNINTDMILTKRSIIKNFRRIMEFIS